MGGDRTATLHFPQWLAWWPRRHFVEVLVLIRLTAGGLAAAGLICIASITQRERLFIMAAVLVAALVINLMVVWPRTRRRLQQRLVPLAVLDEITIAILLALSGGVVSPLVLFFLFPIGQVAIGVSTESAFVLAALSAVLYSVFALPWQWQHGLVLAATMEHWRLFNLVGADVAFFTFAWAAGQVGQALRLQEDRLLQRSTRLRREVATLARLARTTARQSDLISNLASVLDTAVEELGVERAAVLLSDTQQGLRVAATRGFAVLSTSLTEERLPEHPVIRQAIAECRTVTAHRLLRRQMQRPDHVIQQTPGSIASPLLAGDVCLGCLYVDAGGRSRHWSDDSVQLLEALADIAAVSLENSRLYSSALAEKSKLEATMGAVNDALLIYEPNGRIVLANDSFRALFEVGANIDDLTIGDLLQSVEEQRRLGLFTSPEVERQLFQPDPAELEIGLPARTVQRRGQTVYDESENPLVYVLTFHDVTEERQAERVRSEILASVSHELRTPLTSIKGFMQIFERRFQRNEVLASGQELQLVLQQVDRLAGLVDDLLDVAGLPGSHIPLQRSLVQVSQLCAESAAQCARETGRVIKIADRATHAVGYWDREKVQHALDSLLSNAIKYSDPDTPIELWCDLTSDIARIGVRDQGVGLSSEQADHVFDAFYRVDNGTTRRTNGLGLGLYLCRRMAEAHGGSVAVHSTPGQGSEFILALPAARFPTYLQATPTLPRNRDAI